MRVIYKSTVLFGVFYTLFCGISVAFAVELLEGGDFNKNKSFQKITTQILYGDFLEDRHIHRSVNVSADLCGISTPFRQSWTHKFVPSVFHTPLGVEGGRCHLKDRNGKSLISITCDFKKTCLMQGACVVDTKRQGRRGFNFIKLKVGQNGVKKSVFASFDHDRCPFGYGVWSKEHKKSICMDPYRSVAADPRYHKPGDVLFFPALLDLQLPDGTQHRGYMTVRSSGGLIKGPHRFDFYTGFCKSNHKTKMICNDEGPKKFREIGFGHFYVFKDESCFYNYYKIQGVTKNQVLSYRNYPDLPKQSVQLSLDKIWKKASLNNMILQRRQSIGYLVEMKAYQKK